MGRARVSKAGAVWGWAGWQGLAPGAVTSEGLCGQPLEGLSRL